MRTLKSILYKALYFLIPIGLLLHYGTSYIPEIIEKYYSNFIGKFIIQALSHISGIFPFSIMEILVIALGPYILFRLSSFVIKLVKQKGKRKNVLLSFSKEFVITIGLIYFVFVVGWAINYNRLPFSKIASYDTGKVTQNELEAVCQDLIKQTNLYRQNVKEGNKGEMKLLSTKESILKNAYKGYDDASSRFDVLKGSYGRPKGPYLSKFMSLQGLGGIYCPFTGEPNVNIDMPDSSIPFVACHEMAHQHGFAREDEANYIGYITSTAHPDVDFKYSGYISALVYAMNALYDHDKDKYMQLSKGLADGVKRDFKVRREYWASFEGPIDKVSSAANNVYLKANMQKDGIESYGRMVDLLIFEYREKNKTMKN